MEKRTIKKLEILIFVALLGTVIVSILLLPENALHVFSVMCWPTNYTDKWFCKKDNENTVGRNSVGKEISC